MSNTKPSTSSWLPPHANAEPHRKMMEKLAAMTDEERNRFLVQISVSAGIYTPEGSLTEHYRDDDDPSAQPSKPSPTPHPPPIGS